MNQNKTIYLASPLSQTEDQHVIAYSLSKTERNKILAQKLQKVGFSVFLPQTHQLQTPKET